jgi:hypothetical protein
VLTVFNKLKPLCSSNKLASALQDSAIYKLKQPIGYAEFALMLFARQVFNFVLF